MPVAWEELDELKSGAQWTHRARRASTCRFQTADPWAGYWKAKQTLAAGDEDTGFSPSGGIATVGVTRPGS